MLDARGAAIRHIFKLVSAMQLVKKLYSVNDFKWQTNWIAETSLKIWQHLWHPALGQEFFSAKRLEFSLIFSTHWRSLNHFFMYTCRKIIGITLANIIFGIHVSLASFFANCSSRSDDI